MNSRATIERGNHYVAYLLEQLAPLRDVASKNFFGGVGLVSGATQFAMVMGSVLYFVVDDATRPNYEKLGSSCFSYVTKKRRVDVRKYFSVPADLIEDQDQLVLLAKESIRVARSLQKPPAKRAEKAGIKFVTTRKSK
jgi:DNA transformation protein